MVFQFDSLSDFFWMMNNGRAHGPFVWAAYGITFTGILATAYYVHSAKKTFLKNQAAILRRNNAAQDSPAELSSVKH